MKTNEKRIVVPAPVSVGDIRRVLSLIDESPTNAKAKITVHELLGVADVLREWFRTTGEARLSSSPAIPNPLLDELEAQNKRLWEENERLAHRIACLTPDLGVITDDAAAVVRAHLNTEEHLGADLDAAIIALRDHGRSNWWKREKA